MYEAKAPDFFKYIENGKMRADAPESAKKEFKAWKRDNPMKVAIPKKETKEKLTPKDYDRWGRTCVRFLDDSPNQEPKTPTNCETVEDCGGIKMPDDEELEKLFEQMDRETVRMVVNQNCPSEPLTFAEKLKKARNAAGLTQQNMADLTLIPKRTIEEWERANRVPPSYVQRFVLNELENLKKQ